MTIPLDIAEVLAGQRPWAVACMDNLALAEQLPDGCVTRSAWFARWTSPAAGWGRRRR